MHCEFKKNHSIWRLLMIDVKTTSSTAITFADTTPMNFLFRLNNIARGFLLWALQDGMHLSQQPPWPQEGQSAPKEDGVGREPGRKGNSESTETNNMSESWWDFWKFSIWRFCSFLWNAVEPHLGNPGIKPFSFFISYLFSPIVFSGLHAQRSLRKYNVAFGPLAICNPRKWPIFCES